MSIEQPIPDGSEQLKEGIESVGERSQETRPEKSADLPSREQGGSAQGVETLDNDQLQNAYVQERIAFFKSQAEKIGLFERRVLL